jgi:hypothetical protein
MAPFAAAMTPEDRSALLAALRDEGRDSGGRSRDFAASFAALLAAIRAEPFGRAQLQTLLAEQRAAGVARQAAGERLLVDRIAGMSATQRADYAERLEAAFRRPRRR